MFENYQQLEDFFNDRKNLGIKPGLNRMKKLLLLMDNPQCKIKAIHVAGTNGKGSTITFLKNALINNDYKVGIFMSPSFSGLTGYMFCNDQVITEDQLLALMNEIYPAIKQLDETNDYPTEFEIITVIAFMYFASSVDIAIIETGMGGREDTTNCFKPILSIITNIAQDHTSFLGETLQEIAYHKAGIIKEHMPVVIGDINDPALSIIQNEAREKSAQVYRLCDQFTYENLSQQDDRQSFTWNFHQQISLEIALHTLGNHQVKNSSLAIMSLVYLKKQGYAIDWEKVFVSLTETTIPGRFEVIQTNPHIILDGAHNVAGVQSFLETMNDNYKHGNRHLIFAAFQDKDLQSMLEILAPHFSTITLTSFHSPRAASADDLNQLVPSFKGKKSTHHEWEKVIDEITTATLNKEDYYFVTGSLSFIALVRAYLNDIY